MNYDEAVAECREREGWREISNRAALALCAAWQSPGTTGWTLAAVASCAWSSESLRDRRQSRLSEFHEDLWRTFRNYPPHSEESLVWGALATWAMHGDDEE